MAETLKIKIRFLIISFFIFVASFSYAEGLNGTWVNLIRQAPTTDINRIFKDPSGNIWATVIGKIHFFDGTHWKLYSLADTPFSDNTPFFMDKNSNFFFLKDSVLFSWKYGRWSEINGVSIGYPANGYQAEDGVIYISSSNVYQNGGLFRYDGSTLEKIIDEPCFSVLVDDYGKLWVTKINTDTGFISLITGEPGNWTDITDSVSSLTPLTSGKMSLCKGQNGSVWVNNQGKYAVYKNGIWTYGGGNEYPVFLHFTESGQVWGFGNNGVYKLEDNGSWKTMWEMTISTIDVPDFLVEKDGLIIIFDSENFLYLGNNKWEYFVNYNDLASDIVTSLAYTTDGTLLCGHGFRNQISGESYNKGVSIKKGDNWENYVKKDKIDLLNVYDLKQTPDGSVMAFTDDEFKEFIIDTWDSVDSLNVFIENDMTWDDYGNFWIGNQICLVKFFFPTREVLFPFERSAYTNVDKLQCVGSVVYMLEKTNSSIINIISYDVDSEDVWNTVFSYTNNINDFAIDDEDKFWAATETSLAYYDDDAKRWIDVVGINKAKVIEIDELGRIWVSGYGTTGYYFNGEWTSFPELSEISADYIAFSPDGKVAINAFNRDKTQYYGVYEFTPSTKVENTSTNPQKYLVTGNYPNPFNSSTTIYFELPQRNKVSVFIYSLNGQLVRTLAEKNFPAGKNALFWDGKSTMGEIVSSGMYFYKIKSGKNIGIGKMLLLK